MISAAELAQMREIAEMALPDTCAINRVTLVSDGMGGYTETSAVVGSVACRIGPAGRGNETLVAGQIQAMGSHVITMPAGTDVHEADTITSGGREFNVEGVTVRSTEITLRVFVNEVNAGEGL